MLFYLKEKHKKSFVTKHDFQFLLFFVRKLLRDIKNCRKVLKNILTYITELGIILIF